MSDNVNHPSHYTIGRIEVIDYIKDKLTPDAFVGYCMGNVLKYCSRWEHKGGLEDLKKAQVYLNWAIESKDIAENVKGWISDGPAGIEKIEKVEPKEDAATAYKNAVQRAFISSPDFKCEKCGSEMNKGYAVQVDGKIKKICSTCYLALGK